MQDALICFCYEIEGPHVNLQFNQDIGRNVEYLVAIYPFKFIMKLVI